MAREPHLLASRAPFFAGGNDAEPNHLSNCLCSTDVPGDPRNHRFCRADLMDAAAWLEQHGIDCLRFTARISPPMCARYQQDNPEKCKGCEGHNAQPLPKVRRPRPVGAITPEPRTKKKEPETMAKKKVCADCNQERSIIGRGLCGTCYHRHKRKGTLDEKFPAKSGGALLQLRRESRASSPRVFTPRTAKRRLRRPASQKNKKIWFQWIGR